MVPLYEAHRSHNNFLEKAYVKVYRLTAIGIVCQVRQERQERIAARQFMIFRRGPIRVPVCLRCGGDGIAAPIAHRPKEDR